jgi:transmembrane sensor
MNPKNKLPESLHEFQDIWDLSKNYIPKETNSNDESWERFQEKLRKQSSNTTSKPALKISYIKWVSIAAALTIFALSGLLFFNSKVKPISGSLSTKNQIKSFKLEDGSNVILSANSTVTYSFSENKREIKLSGKARFEVAKNPEKPFSVEFNNNKITVLGTGFDITSYNKNKQYVFVNHGKVKLESANEEIILTKNLGANINNGKISGYSLPENPIDWNEKTVRFVNADLEYVLSTLSDFFGKDFSTNSNNKQLKFNGSFDFNQTPDEIAIILTKSLNTPISVK